MAILHCALQGVQLICTLSRRLCYSKCIEMAFVHCANIWFVRPGLDMKALPHSRHWNGFSPVCTLRCWVRPNLFLKALSHSCHCNGFSWLCTLRWSVNLHLFKKALLQSVHWNGFSSLCTEVICHFKFWLECFVTVTALEWSVSTVHCELFSQVWLFPESFVRALCIWRWSVNLYLVEKVLSQSVHWNGLSPVCTRRWATDKFILFLKALSHLVHWKVSFHCALWVGRPNPLALVQIFSSVPSEVIIMMSQFAQEGLVTVSTLEWNLPSVHSFLISIDPPCRGLCCGLGTVLPRWPHFNVVRWCQYRFRVPPMSAHWRDPHTALLLGSISETDGCILSPAYSYWLLSRLDVKQGYILVFFAHHRNITFLDTAPLRKWRRANLKRFQALA